MSRGRARPGWLRWDRPSRPHPGDRILSGVLGDRAVSMTTWKRAASDLRRAGAAFLATSDSVAADHEDRRRGPTHLGCTGFKLSVAGTLVARPHYSAYSGRP